MSTTNITSTNVNGILDISTAQNIGAGVNATITDESILLRNSIATNNTTGTVVVTNSCIKIPDIDNAFSYGSNTQTNSTIEINDSYVEWNLTSIRRNIRLSKIIGTHIRATNTASTGLAFLYTQAGNKAVLDSKDGKFSVIDGIYVHEIAGAPLTYQNTIYKRNGLNILNWEAGDLSIRNVIFNTGITTFTSYTGADGNTYNTADGWLGNGNSLNRLRYYDCTINLSKILINRTSVNGDELLFKYWSRTEKYYLGSSTFSNAIISFTPSATLNGTASTSPQAEFFCTLNSTGDTVVGGTAKPKIDLVISTGVTDGTQRNTGLSDPASVYNYRLKTVTWNRKIRAFEILEIIENVTPTEQIGAGTPSRVYLSSDPNITGTSVQASAITGVSFSVTAGVVTVTITSNKTTQQIYNYWKVWSSLQVNWSVLQNLITINNNLLYITGSITTNSIITGSGFAANGISCTGTAAVSGSGAYSNIFVNDNTGNTKKLTGINDVYVQVKDNLNNVIVTYAKQTGDIYFRTVTGRTYTITARMIGYQSFTDNTITDATGTYTVTLARDKVLWPLDSTKTVANLRTDADALTVYALDATGNITLKDSGTLYNAYLKFSRIAEMDITKTVPAFDGTTLTVTGNASMEVGATVGINDVDKNLVVTGTYTGVVGNIFITDVNGSTKKITGINDCYVQVKDEAAAVKLAYSKQTGDVYIRTVTGKNYTVDIRCIGYTPLTDTYTAAKGTYTASIIRDRVLWPLDSTDTVADLRTKADALTGYSLSTTGAIGAPDGCTLAKVYLATSRFAELDVAKTLPTYSNNIFASTNNFTLSAGNNGITGTGTLNITGTYSGSIGTVTVNDATGGTKFITGVNNCYVSVDDNDGASIKAYSIQTGNFGIKTTTGKTYSIITKQLGYNVFSGTFDSTSGNYDVVLTRDKTLWPLDSTKTQVDLRTDADSLTGYILSDNGNLEFPSNGTLSKAYLSFSRQQEQNKNKTTPVYNGSLMTGINDATMTSGKLTGAGTLTIAGEWTGDLGSVVINDVNGGTKIISGLTDSYVELKDDLNNEIITYSKQTQDYLFKASNQRTYTLLVRRMGYQSYTTTLDGISGTFTVTQNRDKVLWPLDSTKTVSDLRTEALAITGYTLNIDGSVVFKNSGNLKDAHMSFSYQEELDSTKTSPTYDGTTMTTLSDSSMNDINGLPLIGNGNIVVGGLWSGDIDDVGVTDSNGVRIVIKEDNGILSNVGTLHNYELPGQEEKYVTNKSKHILTVVKGHTFRFCIGAKGYITQFRNLNAVDKPQKITVILSIDSNIDSSVDLTPWNDAVSLHTLDTANNTLAILFKAGTIQPALGQAGLADLTNKEQYMRLANRLSDSLLMYTTSSGAKLKGQNITLLTAPGVGDYDNVELLAYVEGPDNFVINPKVSTQTFAGPDKSQVVVTKVRPQIAKVETEQMASIAILARDYIERDAGLLKKIVNPKITKN